MFKYLLNIEILIPPLYQLMVLLMVNGSFAHFPVSAGCDVNARNGKEQTPLYTACEKGNAQVVERLLSLPGVSTRGAKVSTIPIHVATTNNFSHIVQQLIDVNCDFHVVSRNRNSCLTVFTMKVTTK